MLWQISNIWNEVELLSIWLPISHIKCFSSYDTFSVSHVAWLILCTSFNLTAIDGSWNSWKSFANKELLIPGSTCFSCLKWDLAPHVWVIIREKAAAPVKTYKLTTKISLHFVMMMSLTHYNKHPRDHFLGRRSRPLRLVWSVIHSLSQSVISSH